MWKYLMIVPVLFLALAGCDPIGPVEGAPVAAVKADVDQADAKDPVALATIGKATITRSEFEELYKRMSAQSPEIMENTGHEQILDTMIEMEIFYQEALDRGLREDPDIKMHMEQIEKQILVSKLLETEHQVFQNMEEVSPEQAKAYYDEHIAEFSNPPKAQVSHVILKDEETAKKVLALAKGGKDFASLIQEYSIDPNKEKDNGSLGWFAKGTFFKGFEDPVFAGKKGDIVGPVQTPFGFHVVLVEDMKPEETMSFSEASDRVTMEVRRSRADAWKDEYLGKLKEKFPVKKFPENLPAN